MYIFIILFVVLAVLLFVLMTLLKQKSKRQKAYAYGKKNFDVELPKNNTVFGALSYTIPPLAVLSEAEAFMVLIVPYLGSLSGVKRKKIHKELENLSGDLKIDKEVFRFFMDEYEKYTDLTDDQAADIWRGKTSNTAKIA